MPQTSVIIPTYNRAAYLGEAISSVLDQDFSSLELIVVDDGSTDGTPEVIARFPDPRLTYLYQDNQGGNVARNAGIKRSTGEYVAFLDSDDFYLPDRFPAAVEILNGRPDVGLVAGGHALVDEAGNRITDIRPWVTQSELNAAVLLYSCPFIPGGAIVRRDWLERVGGFDPALRIHQDWDLWLRLAGVGCGMQWLERILLCYRLHPDNKGKADGRISSSSIIAILDRFFADRCLSPELRAHRDRAYSLGYVRGAWREYATGHTSEAKDHVARAMALDADLFQGSPARALDILLAWGGWLGEGDRVANARTVLDNLPAEAAHLRRFARRALAREAATMLFRAYASRDSRRVRSALWQIVRNDPTRLANRGLLSIALESLLGATAMRFVRRFTHTVARRSRKQNSEAAPIRAEAVRGDARWRSR